jgi:uncharacterized protein (TIGR00369 family)
MNKENKFQILKHVIEDEMPANKLLHLKILDMEEGFTKIHIPFRDEFIGDFIQNRWHGGIQASIADTVGGIAAMTTTMAIEEKVSTIDMRIDFLHGSEPKDFYAEAEVIKNGKRIVKVDVKLYHENDKVIAIARCVFSVLRKEN